MAVVGWPWTVLMSWVVAVSLGGGRGLGGGVLALGGGCPQAVPVSWARPWPWVVAPWPWAAVVAPVGGCVSAVSVSLSGGCGPGAWSCHCSGDLVSCGC